MTYNFSISAFRICGVVVAFNPDLDRLRIVLAALAPQVDRILLVDNDSNNSVAINVLAREFTNTAFLKADENIGVAAAFNLGIEIAQLTGFSAILLMDQDSVPSARMVENLLLGILHVPTGQLAVIGPRFLDRYSGRLSQHILLVGWQIVRIKCRGLLQPVEVDSLITSGSLIPTAVLQVVGLFDKRLFIDHVDSEWVLRAQHLGFHAYGDCVATMEHDIGEFRQHIWLGRWRDVSIHKSFRYYYIFRNSVWLIRQPYVAAAWKRSSTIRLLQLFSFMTLFHPQRSDVIKMILRGLRDGFKGKMGKIRSD